MTGHHRLYLMRHCESEANRRCLRCGGDWDVPLSEAGLAAAARIAARIGTLSPAPGVIVTAPLIRTRATANILAGALGVAVVEVEALRERRLGDWNGTPVSDSKGRLRAGEVPPGGEDSAAFARRVEQGFERVLARLAAQPLIVASRGIGRVVNEILTGIPNVYLDPGGMLAFDLAAGAPSRARQAGAMFSLAD